jgi:PAS domain-containing protein
MWLRASTPPRYPEGRDAGAGIQLGPGSLPAPLSDSDGERGALSGSAIGALQALVYMHHRNQVEADLQAELREREQRLLLALQAATMGIWDSSSKGDRFTVTPGVERILGLQPGEAS